MNVVAKRTLRVFWGREPKARKVLETWYKIASSAEWTSHHDVKETFRSADIVGDNRIIFDVGGNKYRVVAHMAYEYKAMFIKFVGTHKDYDDIDPETV